VSAVSAVSAAAAGTAFTDFNARYIDGREAFPYAAVFPLAGLTAVVDSNRLARVGIQSTSDSAGAIVQSVTPGGAFASAGGVAGDELIRVGEFDASAGTWAEQFRARYNGAADGTLIPVVVRRGGQSVTLQVPLRFVTLRSYRVILDPKASPSALRIRHGIMTGTVDP
jgi:predicted metalloprotease with PDZ domain